MDIAEALELKDKFLSSYTAQYAETEAAGRDLAAIVESFSESKPADRLAIGISSEANTKSVRLELRVQRTDGPAFLEAKRISDEVRGEARILTLRRLEFPSYSSLLGDVKRASAGAKGNNSLRIGDPVRCRRAGPGTLGGFVQAPRGPGFLSSSHVMAAHASGERPRKKDTIYRQPPGLRSIFGDHEVGELLQWNDFDKAMPNYIDAAFAQISNDMNYEGNVIPAYPNVPKELHGCKLVAMPKASQEGISKQFKDENYRLLGNAVAKIGSASGYSLGMLSGALIDGITAFVPWLGNVIYGNVFEISPKSSVAFTQPGDSGSAVFIQGENLVFGLHFATADAFDERNQPLGYRVSYACSVQAILYEFDGYTWL